MSPGIEHPKQCQRCGCASPGAYCAPCKVARRALNAATRERRRAEFRATIGPRPCPRCGRGEIYGRRQRWCTTCAGLVRREQKAAFERRRRLALGPPVRVVASTDLGRAAARFALAHGVSCARAAAVVGATWSEALQAWNALRLGPVRVSTVEFAAACSGRGLVLDFGRRAA